MKKQITHRIFSIIILPVFLASVSGWTLFIHHCTHCNKNTFSVINQNAEDCCEKPHHHFHTGKDVCCEHSSSEDEEGCCKHNSVVFKVKSDFERYYSSIFNLFQFLYCNIEKGIHWVPFSVSSEVFRYFSPPIKPVLGFILLSFRL